MRLWSIHPKYLDAAGLTACWREALLARKVLMGQTKGYKFHPQLVRFRDSAEPLVAINKYLHAVWEQAQQRGYHFDQTKISSEYIDLPCERLIITDGQIGYEWLHLLDKLSHRNSVLYKKMRLDNNKIEPHPLFIITSGGVEKWEKI